MAALRNYSSIAQPTTLTSSITNSTVSVVVGATTGFPASFPYTISVDYGTVSEELMDVTSAAGTTLTVTRGVDGTTAIAHAGSAVVRHVASGRDWQDSRNHEAASTNVHGLSGGAAVVGDISTQTLTNKTLTAPVLGGSVTGTYTLAGTPTLSGTFAGTPTFSGAVVLSGTPSFTAGAALGSGTYSGAAVFSGGPSFTTAAPSIASSLLTGWGGAWTVFSPNFQWGGSSTNVTSTGRYLQIGKMIIVSAQADLTGAPGAVGNCTMTLPTAPRNAVPDPHFYARIKAAAVTTAGQGVVSATGSSTLNIQSVTSTANGTLTTATQTIPGTWGTGDSVRIFGFYEAV